MKKCMTWSIFETSQHLSQNLGARPWCPLGSANVNVTPRDFSLAVTRIFFFDPCRCEFIWRRRRFCFRVKRTEKTALTLNHFQRTKQIKRDYKTLLVYIRKKNDKNRTPFWRLEIRIENTHKFAFYRISKLQKTWRKAFQ